VLTDEDAKKLLHFRGLFNTLVSVSSFAYEKMGFQKEFEEKYAFKNFDNLLNY
jgi:hypothetical protein